MVVVYTLRPFDQYIARNPQVQLDTFVDDFVGSARDTTKPALINKLAEAAVARASEESAARHRQHPAGCT